MLNDVNCIYPANKSQMYSCVENIDGAYNLGLSDGFRSLMSPMARPHCDLVVGLEGPLATFVRCSTSVITTLIPSLLAMDKR